MSSVLNQKQVPEELSTIIQLTYVTREMIKCNGLVFWMFLFKIFDMLRIFVHFGIE